STHQADPQPNRPRAVSFHSSLNASELLDLASIFFFFSSRRRHTRSKRDWSSDVCSSDLDPAWPMCGLPDVLYVDGGVGELVTGEVAAVVDVEHVGQAAHRPGRVGLVPDRLAQRQGGVHRSEERRGGKGGRRWGGRGGDKQ